MSNSQFRPSFPGVPPQRQLSTPLSNAMSPFSRQSPAPRQTMSHSPVVVDDEEFKSPPHKKPKLLPSSQPPNVIDIIPNGPPGDTVIQVKLAPVASDDPAKQQAPRTTLIRVHSLILTLVSPFFAQLLPSRSSPQHGYTPTSPLQLPDDIDGAAFLDWVLMICDQAETLQKNANIGPSRNAKVMSGAQSSTDRSKKNQQAYLGRFPRIVALAERLGCAKAMKSRCSMPLWRFFGPRGQSDEDGLGEAGLNVLDAVAIAYVVGDSTLFQRATEYALVHYDHEQLEEKIGGGLSKILPGGLIENIKSHRRTTLRALERDLYKPVLAIHAKLRDPEDPEENAPVQPCEIAQGKLATYTLQMCHLRRGGMSLVDRGSCSLMRVWDGLESMVDILSEDSNNKKCRKTCEGGCTVDVKAAVEKAVERSKEDVKGCCLQCVVEKGQALGKSVSGAGGENEGSNGDVGGRDDEDGDMKCTHEDV